MPERRDLLIEVFGHAGDLGLGQRVDAESFDQLVHPAGGDPGQVAVRHDGDQRGFGPLATLEQPLGKVGARAELGDGDVDGADPGIQGPVAITVAVVGAL